MSCYSCTGLPSCNCSCCNPCTSIGGCPIQLDTSCVFYHKDNSEVTALTNLNQTNGTTLDVILEAIDVYIGQMKVTGWSLPYLRLTYAVNSLQQFGQAIDTSLSSMATDVATALSQSQTAITANDSATIDFTTSSTLNHTITASVKVSAVSGNLVTAQVDGIHVAPQTLSVNYSTKELTITNGNTISFASFFTGASGYLGEVSADPTAVNGQYWFNTTSSQLKIKLNGVVRIISIT